MLRDTQVEVEIDRHSQLVATQGGPGSGLIGVECQHHAIGETT